MLIDQHNRTVNYLRLSVTDKCNLRCFYCMPEEGIAFLKKKSVLSYEEMLRICSVLTANGVDKIRITGGEPFVRKDLDYFLSQLTKLNNPPEISITTNATLLEPYIDQLKKLGIRNMNVSLDALEAERFFAITRRDTFQEVFSNLQTLIRESFNVKLNCVVMDGMNIDDMVPLAELAKHHNISVRFLEEMPFDARSGKRAELKWNFKAILDHLADHFGALEKVQDKPNSTALNYRIKGFKGEIGVIPSFSRTFCGSCNRIRISANGDFRTCLYGPSVLNLRDQLRQGNSDDELLSAIKAALGKKPANGFIAEDLNKQKVKDSMAYLGG